MNPTEFKPHAPGRIVSTIDGQPAFVPNPLPPDWEFPISLWPLLAEAKHQIGILDGIGRNLPNPAILLRPLSNREAIRSSRLEGTYVTAREMLLFDLMPDAAARDSAEFNDRREVRNYARAWAHATTTELPLSLRLIREVHDILMHGVRGRDRTPGAFRQIQVGIGSGTETRFVPPPPGLLNDCLEPFEKYVHRETSQFDPIVDCFLAHYQFEAIHPFQDGNGRVGRLILSYMLQQKCRLSKPWLYMSEYFERHRDEYIERLYRISTDAAWHEWIEFCLGGLVEQTRETIVRCERLQALRARIMERVSNTRGSVRLNTLVERIFDSPFLSITEAAALIGVTYPTAKADILRLVDAGILRELPEVTPKVFYAPDIYEVAYDRLEED